MTAGRTCRRTACWSLPDRSKIACWQHAVEVARNNGDRQLIHWVTGEHRPIPAPTPVKDTAVPTGVDSIIRALNKVRTRRGLALARYAICKDIAVCHDQRSGLKHDLSVALTQAKARVGVSASHRGTGVRR